jgi:hypothetical protein
MNNFQETINQIQQLTEDLKQQLQQSEVRSPVDGVYYDDTAMWVGNEDKDKAPLIIQFKEQWQVDERLCDNEYCLTKGKKEINISNGMFVEGFTKKQAKAIAKALNNLEE